MRMNAATGVDQCYLEHPRMYPITLLAGLLHQVT